MLTGVDKAHYRQAFMLQRTGRFAEADKELSRVGNTLLTQTVLAERYLSKKFTAQPGEINHWLESNADMPAANAIYRLALSRKTLSSDELAPVKSKYLSSGYARSALHDNKTWEAGLAAFRRNDMSSAAQHFRTLADNENALANDDKAAACFWAYRALKAHGDKTLAARYLDKASDVPSGFYSLLARTLTGENKPTAVMQPSAAEMKTLLAQLPVRRAVALKEIGEDNLAQAELRSLYTKATKKERNTLLALTQKLELPVSQMRMAGVNADGRESFPMPDWQPTSGYQVERALLFAIMRQESGFDPKARSASGAVGLMQLMPATASAMAHENHQLGKSLDPSVNMTLGQRYIEHLMSTPQIGDNLIYLTAAYNAGPGSVANWQHNGHGEKDPLLFVESLPFAQTRDYVMHVVTNYWVYSQLMGVSEPSSLTALASGDWPRYEGAERQLVALLNKAD